MPARYRTLSAIELRERYKVATRFAIADLGGAVERLMARRHDLASLHREGKRVDTVHLDKQTAAVAAPGHRRAIRIGSQRGGGLQHQFDTIAGQYHEYRPVLARHFGGDRKAKP